MENLKKLSRADMKNVQGGKLASCSCKNECTSYDDCPGSQTCDSVSCMGSSPSCNYTTCTGKI